jgi:hypothetical protein
MITLILGRDIDNPAELLWWLANLSFANQSFD